VQKLVVSWLLCQIFCFATLSGPGHSNAKTTKTSTSPIMLLQARVRQPPVRGHLRRALIKTVGAKMTFGIQVGKLQKGHKRKDDVKKPATSRSRRRREDNGEKYVVEKQTEKDNKKVATDHDEVETNVAGRDSGRRRRRKVTVPQLELSEICDDDDTNKKATCTRKKTTTTSTSTSTSTSTPTTAMTGMKTTTTITLTTTTATVGKDNSGV
jgi:hypothetical protein